MFFIQRNDLRKKICNNLSSFLFFKGISFPQGFICFDSLDQLPSCQLLNHSIDQIAFLLPYFSPGIGEGEVRVSKWLEIVWILFLFLEFLNFILSFYTEGSYYLSILNILVYICQSQSPNLFFYDYNYMTFFFFNVFFYTAGSY